MTDSKETQEPFQLQNDPPPRKAWRGEVPEKRRQTMLFSGLDCVPGQLDLFATDWVAEGDPQTTETERETKMKSLNKQATAVFKRLTEGLTELGDHCTIANNDTFMAVHVELIGGSPLGPIFSVAHYFEQNGDLMKDPDVEFLLADGGVAYPLTFQQDPGIYREWVRFEGDRVLLNPRGQADLVKFCNMWMRNIKAQQYAGGLRRTASSKGN